MAKESYGPQVAALYRSSGGDGLVAGRLGPRRSALLAEKTAASAFNIEQVDFRPEGMQVNNLYRKKTQTMDKPVVRRRPDPGLCPVQTAEDLIAALGRSSGPLFVRIDRPGTATQPTR